VVGGEENQLGLGAPASPKRRASVSEPLWPSASSLQGFGLGRASKQQWQLPVVSGVLAAIKTFLHHRAGAHAA